MHKSMVYKIIILLKIVILNAFVAYIICGYKPLIRNLNANINKVGISWLDFIMKATN